MSAEEGVFADGLEGLRARLREAEFELRDGPAPTAKLAELRGLYEEFVNALSCHFLRTAR